MKYLILIIALCVFSIVAKADKNNYFMEAKDLFDNKEEEVAESNDALDILDVPKFLKRQDA